MKFLDQTQIHHNMVGLPWMSDWSVAGISTYPLLFLNFFSVPVTGPVWPREWAEV